MEWELSKKAWEDEDPDEWDWNLINPEESWRIYTLMQNFSSGMGGPQFLPFAGGLLDQPEWFIHDYAKISMRLYIRDKERLPDQPLGSAVRFAPD